MTLRLLLPPLAMLAASLLLTACSGVSHLARPSATLPDTFAPDDTTDPAADDSLSIADLAWWEFYSDPALRSIIEKALDNNRDLLKAAARIEEMRQLYAIDKANMLPEAAAEVYANHETNRYGGGATTHDTELGLKFPVAWEINLFGALTWGQKQGRARYLASAEDYRALRVAVIAAAADAYFRLVALDSELSIVRRTVATRGESLRMAKLRFEGGLTSETVYRQAQVEYASAAALVPALEQKLTAVSNALTLLMGEYPREIERSDAPRLSSILTEDIPAGIPSALLRRRPDIRGAEQRLSAAMAGAGLTYADRFPRLRIGVTPGFENDALRNFLKSPFSYVVGSVAGPIVDFGRRKRKYKAAVAVYEQARLDYEHTVVRAFTEVSQAIAAYRNVRQTSRLKMELRDATAKYNELAHMQYRAGTLSYIDVLDSQRRYFDAQVDVSNAIRDEYLALVDLYKVLGGGWQLPADAPRRAP